MKYKVGDKVLLMAEITDIECEEDVMFPYSINVHLGNNEVGTYYACTEDAIISIFNGDIAIIPLDTNEPCGAYHSAFGHTICHGTKEMDVCNCGGDQSKCDFYESIRNKSKERIYTIAESTSEGTIVTAEMYQAVLKNIQKLQFYEIMAIFKWSDYEAPLNKESCLEVIVKRYTPKEVVDAYEQWRFKNTVSVGDVIKLINKNKDYLVTKIFNCIVYMIALDGETKEETNGNIEKIGFEKVGKNMTIQEFFSKEV